MANESNFEASGTVRLLERQIHSTSITLKVAQPLNSSRHCLLIVHPPSFWLPTSKQQADKRFFMVLNKRRGYPMDSGRLIPSTLLVCVAHVTLWFQAFVKRLIADHDPYQAVVRHGPLPTVYTNQHYYPCVLNSAGIQNKHGSCPWIQRVGYHGDSY